MNVLHRISIRTTDAIRQELSDLGFETSDGLVTIEVDESHPRWPDIARFVTRHRAVDVVSTRSSATELANAPWLQIKPEWHYGYPQPQSGFLETTFDLSDHCPECGVGAIQRAPFRMKGEPKWGKRDIFQLNWVFDEFFVRREVWENVFLPLGIRARPVIAASTGLALNTVVQCDFDVVAEWPLKLGDHAFEWCKRCERRKYRPWTRGCFPAFEHPLNRPSAVKSREYFGDGAKAFRAVLASQELFSAIERTKVKGCSFLAMCVAEPTNLKR